MIQTADPLAPLRGGAVKALLHLHLDAVRAQNMGIDSMEDLMKELEEKAQSMSEKELRATIASDPEKLVSGGEHQR